MMCSSEFLTEDDMGYEFRYDSGYLQSDVAVAVSLTLPLTEKPYREKVLFPFFDGLIPEGWLLDIAEQSWKISARDRFSCWLHVVRTASAMSVSFPLIERRKSMDKCLFCYKPLAEGDVDLP